MINTKWLSEEICLHKKRVWFRFRVTSATRMAFWLQFHRYPVQFVSWNKNKKQINLSALILESRITRALQQWWFDWLWESTEELERDSLPMQFSCMCVFINRGCIPGQHFAMARTKELMKKKQEGKRKKRKKNSTCSCGPLERPKMLS